MSRATPFVLTAIAAGLGLALQLSTPGHAGPAPAITSSEATAQADRALLVEADRELAFVQALAMLGIQRGADASTKLLAAEQFRRAEAAGLALEAVAEERQLELTQRLGAAELEAIEQLLALPAVQFDRGLAQGLEASHRRQIERLDRARQASADPRIRWWSETALDERVAAHEQVARQLEPGS